MKKTLSIILALLVLLTSCELFNEESSSKRIRMVSVALDYSTMEVSHLKGTINDQRAVLNQFMHLAANEETPFSAICFTQEGDHAYSSSYEDGFEGGKHIYYNPHNKATLKNAVVTALEDMASESRDGDITIFYYAGHGVNITEAEEDISYLHGAMVLGDIKFPAIGSWKRENENLACMLPLSELRRLMNQFKGRSLIILDSCYSGAIVDDDAGMSDHMDIRSAFANLIGYPSTKQRTIWQLTAARADELSYEEEAIEGVSHGRFTKALLETMGYRFGDDYESPGLPTTRRISIAELWNETMHALGMRNQTPQSSQSVYDLVLFNL